MKKLWPLLLLSTTYPAAARLGRTQQGCPGLYPKNIAYNFTKDFFLRKINATARLSALVNAANCGPDGTANDYERFDCFTDPNDLALVAKTFDGVCVATFSATGSTGLMNTIGGLLSELSNDVEL